MKAVNLLRELGYSELACQFAAYIGRQQQQEDPLVTLTAGLLSEAVSDGHVCLNLGAERSFPAEIKALLPDRQSWLHALKNSDVVGAAGEFKPLIVSDDGLLYLYRFWQDEQQVAGAIRQRSQPIEPAPDTERIKAFFDQWLNESNGIDWQKIAVLTAMHRQLCVISGGPGTGKTTVVLKILQCLQLLYDEEAQQRQPLRVALAAPTGKAAARLQQAISQQGGQNLEAKTLHRLLGISARFDQGRFSAERPLPVDVLIVDEASMIDISLMALTLKALPLHARLILLGDSDQLASVESGAVLASLCATEPAFSDRFRQLAQQSVNVDLPPGATAAKLEDSVVKLRHSYRFAAGGQIGQLAEAVNRGDADQVCLLLGNARPQQLFPASQSHIQAQLLQGYQAYIEAVEKRLDADQCLQAFEQFRCLCALKQGPQSVAAVNLLMLQLLAQRGWRIRQPFFAGRPIMITQNHYRLNLFNGDIGLILPNAEGDLQACFSGNGELRWLPLSRLPAHETVFAMTVHKSQGSEFDKVALLLPDEDSPLLTRELVYTAITRARETVEILSATTTLQQAVVRRHQRESGLEALLLQ